MGADRGVQVKGLRARVMAVIAVATVAPTILVGALAVRRARRDVQREVVRGNLALVRALGAGLDGTLQDARETLRLAGSSWADSQNDSERLVRRVKRELPVVRRAAVLDPDGRLVAGDALDVHALERANTYGGWVSDVYREAGTPLALLVVQARGRTGELFGFFAAELDLRFVREALGEARLGPGARLWVVDASGVPVGWSAPEAAPPRVATQEALAAAEEGDVEQDGVLAVYRNLASYQTVRGVSWAIVLEQPTSEAYALAAATTRDTALAGAAVLAVALLLGWILATRLTRPLTQLAARAAAIGEGSPPQKLPVDAPGEIGLLAQKVEEMARRVEERQRLEAALARGEKLATVGALAAGVAHEINNPLTTILGYAVLLLEDKPAGRERDALELVAEEARRVQGIVRTLLDHARLDAGEPVREPVDVNAVIERTAALVAPAAKARGVRVVTELAVAAGLPRPPGDPRRLEQVLVNLAQNATQAMEKGGVLTIRSRPDGARVAIEVCDTGPGIPAEQLGSIFEPFFTTKGPGVGTGLGLAIARQIVQDHGGSIAVESEVGRGSTFKVVI
jgi:two-component system NtrC family sensor kinase